jgi:hypothetical protein
MIEPDINEQLGSFAPSQGNADLLQNVVSQESLSMTEAITPRRSFVLPTAPPQPQLDPALKAAVDEMANQRSAVLNSSLYNATKKNPDTVAEAQRVGKQMGVGADIAERNLAELQRGAMMLKALDRNLAISAPKTANSLTEPDFANIAYDDLENLTGTEKLMRWFAGTDFFKGAQGTFISTEMATIDQLNSEGMATSKDFERYKELQRDLQIVGQPAPYSISGNIANLLASVEAGAEIGAQYAVTGAVLGGAAGAIGGPLAPATMPAGMALGGTAGFATGMAKWMYQSMAGESYRQLREGDVSHEVALPMSRGIGVITSALEFAGLGAELYIASGVGKKIFAKELATDVTAELSKQMIKKATASEAVWDASKLYFGEILTESTVEGLQTAITRVGTEIGRAYDRPDLQNMFQTPEGRRAIISEAVDSFVNVAIGMSVAGLPLPAANYYMDRGRYADAKRSQQFYEDLSKNAVDSKMRQRNPDAAERFYADQVDGTGAETTYVDGRVMQNILNQSGLTNEQVDTVLPGIRQQLAEAISIGGDVTIPTATYAARLAGTKLGDSMKIHMRPNANAWSADTAVKYAGQLEQEKEKALALLEEKETTDTAFVNEARVIEKDMQEKLAAVGRDPKLAKAEATIFRDMMVVAAAEAKMTPAAYMAQHGPDVVGPQAQAAPAAPQQVAPTVPTNQSQTVTPESITELSETTAAAQIEVTSAIESNALNERDGKRANESLFRMGFALKNGKIADIAVQTWRAINRNIPQLSKMVAKANELLKKMGVEIVDPTGQIYTDGWAEVEVVAWEPYEEGQESPDEYRVVKTMEPIVRQNGQIIKRGEVIVRDIRPESAMSPAEIEAKQKKQDELKRRLEEKLAATKLAEQAAPTAPLEQAAMPAQVLEQAAKADANAINKQAAQESDDTVATAESQPNIPTTIDDAISLDSVAKLATGRAWERGRDLKVEMQKEATTLASGSGVDLLIDTPQTTEYLTRVGLRDALYALRQNPNSVGWYDEKTRQALAVMALVHPEILTDENARFAFTWALAVTSNGIKVGKNFELAEMVYRRYKSDGKMPSDLAAGTSQEAINNSLSLFNTLRDAWGIDNLRRFAQTEYTIQELKYIVADTDSGGEYASTVVKGAAVLGPKIGNGFFSNLYGDFRSLTMDRWLVRTWGRWTGTLIMPMPVQTQNARTRLQTVITSLTQDERASMASILREAVPKQAAVIDAVEAGGGVDFDALSSVIQKASMDKEVRAKMNETFAGQEVRKAGNGLAKYLDGQKEAPAGPGERVRIRGIFTTILQQLQQLPEYAELTMADLQAALWYAEKRLYETAKEDITIDEEDIEGYADDEAPDYANAAADVARVAGVSNEKISETLQRESNNERSRQSRLQEKSGSPVKARNTAATRGFSDNEKRQFNGAAVIRNDRASRGNIAGSPEPYTRSGDKRNTKPRLVRLIGARVISLFQPQGRLRNALDSAGGKDRPFDAPKFHELEKSPKSPIAFHRLITESKSKSEFGASVYAYTVEEYADMRLFVSEDALSGFALKGDDIVSVFSMSDAAVGHALMQMAVSVGGRRLDAFDTVLPYLYAPHGFRAVARLRWNEGRKPEGWDKKTFAKFNNGEPDVVFMVYDPTYFGQYSNKDGKVVKSEDAAVRVQKKATSNIANGGILEQAAPSPGPARGGYDPKRIQILLNSEADAFTFLHELMHWRMDKMIQSVNNGKASPQEIADLDIMIQSFKLGGESQQERLAIWNAMTFEEQRPHWEAIAYNFENYLFEGKAPSVEMQGVFDRMASFIKRVYVSIRDDLNKIYRREFGKDLPVLTDEVRGVMDRMLASEDQIKRKQAMMQMVPMFLTQEESGMDDATYAAYQAMNKEAEDAAVTDLTKASLKQMQWLSGARSRVLKELQAKHDALRKEIRAEVKAEVDAEPIYAAMSILKTGEGRAKNGEMVKFDDKFKLNLESVKKMIPAEDVAKLGFGKYGMVAADGMDPDMAADMFGFSSGDELVLALLSAKPAKEEINARTDKRMMDENGDMNTPQSQEEAVQRALHNEARFRFNAVEVRWLSKATSPVRVFMDAAKLAAQQIIAGKVIRDLRPSEYQAAEAKAAREAADAHNKRRTAAQAAQAAATKERNAGLSGIAAGVPMSEVEAAAAAKGQEAAQKATERESERKARYGERTPEQVILRAKQIQLLQNQLAREAQDAKDEVSKGVKYLRNVLKAKNVQRMGADIADQVTNMLERFSLANISVEEAGKRLSLAKWIEGQLELGIVPDIDPKLLDESFRKPYQQMTVSEFRDLVSSIQQLEYIGKHENEIRLAGEKVQFVDARDAIVKSIQEEKKDGKKLNPRTATTKGGRALEGIRTFMAAHLKVAAIARIMDGGKDNGKVWNYFIRSANAAGDMETRMIGEATEKVMNILKPVKALGNMEGGRVYFKSIDRSLNRGERFVIALNSGNEGNLQRMRDGEGWTMDQLAPVLESLSSTEWNAVQAIWNHFETYKPLVEAKERRLYGKAPNWIEVKPFAIKTSDGKTLNLEGGYYPIKYDPKASDAAEQFTDAETAKAQMKGAFTAATTRRSYVKNRAERVVGRPLMLTMTGVYSGLGEVIHDLSWHEWLISANRMMKDRGFSSAVNETYGPEIKRQMKDWIKDVAAGQGAADQGAANFATWMRRSISSARLGFNVTSGIMQVSGFANTWVRIDGTLVPKWTAIGVGSFVLHPKKMMSMIQEKSSMMRNLGRTQFRDLNEIRNTMQDKDGKWNAIHANAYIFCRVMQSMVNYPTWAGAYEKSLFEGNNEDTSIALADQAVIDSQGGGQLKDLASVERGGAWSKLFTVFYGYQNALFNSMATSVMTQKKSTAAAQLTLLVAVPAVYKYYVNQAVKAKRKDNDDDEEKGLAAFVAEESIQTMLGSMIGIRELGNLAKFDSKDVRDYSGPSGLAMMTDIYNVTIQARQNEWDAAYRRALLNLAGDLFGIPAVQINRTIDGIQLMIDKNNADLRAPIFGTRR